MGTGLLSANLSNQINHRENLIVRDYGCIGPAEVLIDVARLVAESFSSVLKNTTSSIVPRPWKDFRPCAKYPATGVSQLKRISVPSLSVSVVIFDPIGLSFIRLPF